MIYTVTMNPAIDYVVQLADGLHPGFVNRSTGEDFQFGGKGINVSNMLRQLGQDTVALGFVAGATGAWLEQGLANMGLSTRFVHLDRGMTRINVKVKAEEETEINGMGPVIGEADLGRLYAQLETLTGKDVLVLSGSVPGSLRADAYARILARLQEQGVLTVVDAAGELLMQALQYRPFLIKPNHRELEDILQKPMDTDESIAAAAKALQDMGARNVLVSLGGSGALLLDEAGTVRRMGAPRGQVVNSVGAGDSMVAGFLAGYLDSGDYEAALRLGVAAGSATAFSLGLADRESVEALLKQSPSLASAAIVCYNS